MKTTNRKWFTLIELIIVVTLLSTLTVLSLPVFDSWIAKQKFSEAKIWISNSWESIWKKYEIDNSYPIPVDDTWVNVWTWVIWYLHSNMKIQWLWNFDLDESWFYTINWNRIFYTIWNDWTHFYLWIKTKTFLQNSVEQTVTFYTNWTVNINDATPFWYKNKTLNVDLIWAKHSEDSNWNWIVEKTETNAKHDF